MQKDISEKNETKIENEPETNVFYWKKEDLDSFYNQENKVLQPKSQSQSQNKNNESSSKQDNSFKKQKIPKNRKRIKTPEFLKTIQKQTNFPAVYVLILIVSCGLFILFHSFEIFYTNLIGLVLPLYWTIRAYNDLKEKNEMKQWYTYWLIYLSLLPLDIILGRFLKHIPLFYFFKYLFLCWMLLPNFQGASYIHDSFIKKRFPDFDIVLKIDHLYEKIRQKIHEYKVRIQSRFFKAHAQEAERPRVRILKKHDKLSSDKLADLHNRSQEKNIHEEKKKHEFRAGK